MSGLLCCSFVQSLSLHDQLRHDLQKRSIPLRSALKPSKNTKVYLHANALKEERYVDDWIQYYLKIGVDKVFIYDNSDANVLDGVPQRYSDDRVVVRHMPGYYTQLIAGRNMTLNHYTGMCHMHCRYYYFY